MNKLIEDALKSLKVKYEKEIATIEGKLYTNHSKDFFDAHDEFKKMLDSKQDRLSKAFMDKVSKLQAKSEKSKKAMMDSCDTKKNDKMMERQIDLQQAVSELNNMFWQNKVYPRA